MARGDFSVDILKTLVNACISVGGTSHLLDVVLVSDLSLRERDGYKV